MIFEDLMLIEIRKSQKNIVWFHLNEVLRVVKTIEKESRMVVARGYREGKVGSYCLMGQRVMEKDDGNDCTVIVSWMYVIGHPKRVNMVKFMLCRLKNDLSFL